MPKAGMVAFASATDAEETGAVTTASPGSTQSQEERKLREHQLRETEHHLKELLSERQRKSRVNAWGNITEIGIARDQNSMPKHRSSVELGKMLGACPRLCSKQSRTTQEKWTKWCEKAARTKWDEVPNCRADPAHLANLVEQQHRSRSILKQQLHDGTHMAASASSMCTWFLQKNLTLEQIEKARVKTMDNVNNRGKRIRKMITDTTRNRQELTLMVEVLQRVEKQG
jgi:hypothetical protein